VTGTFAAGAKMGKAGQVGSHGPQNFIRGRSNTWALSTDEWATNEWAVVLHTKYPERRRDDSTATWLQVGGYYHYHRIPFQRSIRVAARSLTAGLQVSILGRRVIQTFRRRSVYLIRDSPLKKNTYFLTASE
jgi:hypothetical protein